MKTVRIVFEKRGRAKFISHLDLTRTMTRVVRRASIPLWYTEGFNRHPYLTFAAPLSLGYEGLRETMDLRLQEDMPYDELVSRLNQAMPEGLWAVSAAEAVCKPGDLMAASYLLAFDCPADELQSLLAQPEVLVEKKTKKKIVKTIDIRPVFADAKIEETPLGTEMTVTLPCNSAETVNPGLLLTALNNDREQPAHMHVLRTELLDANGAPFR